jgi:uncharacterized membrane protein YebE (DUF533 family)
MNPFDILGSLLKGQMGSSAKRMEHTFGNRGFGAPGGMFGGGPGGMPPGGPGGMGRGGPGGMFGGGPGGMPPRGPGGMGRGGSGGMFGGGPGGMPPGGPGGMPGGGPGGMAGGGHGGMFGGGPRGIFDMLGKIAGSLFGGGESGTPSGERNSSFSPGEILESIGKTVFGDSRGAGSGSAGRGANTLFGALAAWALAKAKQVMTGTAAGSESPALDVDDAAAVLAGMRKPANAEEERQLQSVATLTVRAMINAAKADGRIDDQESERLIGKLREDGVTDEEQRFVMEEIRKPMDTEGLVRAVPNQQVAAQIYIASLMAIEVDTDAERRYMQELADKLGLNRQVTAYLHQTVGLA